MQSSAQQIIASEVKKATGITAVLEHVFHPTRKWRLDLAWPSAMTAVEINGSVWTRGRHTRGAGYLGDREKVNAAQRLGWCVMEYSTEQVDREFGRVIDEIVECIKAREKR